MEVTRCSVSVSATRAPDGHTNAYVLGREPAILVDPATRTPELDRLARERAVEHVLVTHAHPDHTGKVAAYARETGATVWARVGHTTRFRETTGIEPDRTFGPGTTIDLGDGTIRLFDAPGHAPDHVGIVAGDGGPILCGDCAIRDGSVAVGAPDGDVRAYLTTLRRLRVMDPPALLPGHGPPITDVRGTTSRLIAHRLERERRVREAVERGGRTPTDIVDYAYDADLTGVRDLARATVVAHLEKLAVEGDLDPDVDLEFEPDDEPVRPS